MKNTFRLLAISLALVISGCQTKKELNTETPLPPEEIVEAPQIGIYELRTYYAADGKLEDLLSRFRDHTTGLFVKHGMTNIGYGIPLENTDNQLSYIIGHQSRESRDASWKAFREDEEWVKAKNDSEVNGKLVDSVKIVFLKPTDFSPAISVGDKGPRVFEMRTYYTNEGKLNDLHTRFRDHTMGLFEKHGMTNVVYFDLDSDQKGAENTLLYFISHATREAANENWKGFIDDPEWKEVYAASIVDGPLVDHITSVYLTPTDFSPLK